MIVTHGALILEVDGGRMRLLRNHGRANAIALETLAERALDNPPTHKSGESAPGRSFNSSGFSRSAYDVADIHRQHEDMFCRAALDEALEAAGEDALILIAPARTMGVLRKHIAGRVGPPVIREVIRDLTALSPQALAERLCDYH